VLVCNYFINNSTASYQSILSITQSQLDVFHPLKPNENQFNAALLSKLNLM